MSPHVNVIIIMINIRIALNFTNVTRTGRLGGVTLGSSLSANVSSSPDLPVANYFLLQVNPALVAFNSQTLDDDTSPLVPASDQPVSF